MSVPFISIIVPVYNVAQFLSITLDSILNQQYTNYEIILINDGSTDESAEIAQRYASNDQRIVFIDKCNEGVATTRNKGLEVSRGNYIMFLDADDIIYPNTLDKIAAMLRTTNADLLRFEHQTIDEEGNELYPNYNIRRRKKYVGCELDAATFMNKILLNEYYMCLNIFKSSLIKSHHISFLPDCTYNEYTLFILKSLLYSKKNFYIPIKVYGYRKYSEAVTAKFSMKNYEDVKLVFTEIIQMSENITNNLRTSFKTVAESLAIHLYLEKSNMNVLDGDLDAIICQCTNRPVMVEWKCISLLGDKGFKLWRSLFLLKRILNRLM